MPATTANNLRPPASACARCAFEDCTGLCSTMPGELYDGQPSPAEACTELGAHTAPTRRRGLAQAFTLFKIWTLRYRIRSNELYLAECERHGITTGRNLSLFRDDLASMLDQLAVLEGRTW